MPVGPLRRACALALAAGAQVQRGPLEVLDGLRHAAAAWDGVIILAFKHDFHDSSQFQAAAHTELAAIETLGDALAGSDRPFVVASGLAGLVAGRVATERDPQVGAAPAASPRSAGAQTALAFAWRGVRSSIVRLAPSVHGEFKRGFVGLLIDIARQKGVSGYIGDGANRWPAVQRRDAARLFRLALERASAGSVLHGVADEGVPIRAIAEVIGRASQVAGGRHCASGRAQALRLAGVLAIDCPASSALTRSGWGGSPCSWGSSPISTEMTTSTANVPEVRPWCHARAAAAIPARGCCRSLPPPA